MVGVEEPVVGLAFFRLWILGIVELMLETVVFVLHVVICVSICMILKEIDMEKLAFLQASVCLAAAKAISAANSTPQPSLRPRQRRG